MMVVLKRKIKNNKNLFYGFSSFFLPILILLTIFHLTEINPFGDNTLLSIDMKSQYISFFSYLSNVLNGKASAIYSFSNGLGNEMIGLSAYYLMSPFNLLFYFSSTVYLPYWIIIITLLKIGSTGLTMYIYLNTNNSKKLSLIGSIIYALMSYNLVFLSNIMWLDAVIFLPLVINGLDDILENKKSFKYMLFLFLTIITQYYIAFMVCVFLVLYFIVKIFEKNGTKDIMLFIRKSINSILYFITESLLAGGLAAILLIPLIFSFLGGASEGRVDIDNLFSLSRMFEFHELYSKLFIGSFDFNQLVNGLPNVYSSLLILPGIMLYYFNPSVKLKNKISSLILLIILILSFYFEGANIVWHGFTSPIWFPFRYSFILIFLTISIGISGFQIMGTSKISKKKQLLLNLVLFIFYCVIAYNVSLSDYSYLKNSLIGYSVLFLSLYLLLTYSHYVKNNTKNFIFLTTLILIIFEVILNGVQILTITTEKSFSSNDYYDYVQKMDDILEHLPNNIYRIETTVPFNENDPLLFNYQGINHYSSSSREQDKEFLGRLGYRNNGNWAIFADGSSIQADSLLGVRYLLTENYEIPHYSQIYNSFDLNLYKNKYQLPLGFLVNSDEIMIPVAIDLNPISYTNEIYNRINGTNNFSERISDEEIKIDLENVQMKLEKDGYVYNIENSEEDAFIHFTLKTPNENLIQFYFDSEDLYDALIFVNEIEVGQAFNIKFHSVDVASPKSDKLTISLKLESNQLKYKNHYFYFLDLNKFEDVISSIKSQSLNISHIQDGHIIGNVKTSNDNHHILLTIPYDNQWVIKINDNIVKSTSIFDALTLIELPQNEIVTLEMYYRPRGIIIGILISMVSIVLAIIYFKYQE